MKFFEIQSVKSYIEKTKIRLRKAYFDEWVAWCAISDTVAKKMNMSELDHLHMKKATLCNYLRIDLENRIGLKEDRSNLEEVASLKGNTKEFYEIREISKLYSESLLRNKDVTNKFSVLMSEEINRVRGRK